MTASDRESCFRDLFDRNHPRWVGIARAYSVGSDRDDLLQEIMMQVWKSLDSFAGKSSIDTWAYRIALNTALSWRRKAGTRSTKLKIGSTEISQIAGRLDSASAETRVLDEFLASLSKTDRAVLLLYLDDVPNGEAAEITGMTEGNYRVRLHRIRSRFEETYCAQESDR